MKVGDLVRAPVFGDTYKRWAWEDELGIVVGFQDWGHNDKYVVVLIQANNKKCTFKPSELRLISESR